MKNTFLTITTITLLAPTMLFAQIETTLVNLPGMGGGATTFESYINTIYALTITIAAMLAVIKIVIAGVKYMTTDIVTSKGDAKKDIYGAIIGLLVVLAAVLIIEVINPDINDVTLVIEQQNAPAPVVTTVVAPVAITPTQERGYRTIPADTESASRIAFYTSCDGTARVSGDEIRCYELEAAVAADISAGLNNSPDAPSAAVVDGVLQQFEYLLGPKIINNTQQLNAITTEIETATGITLTNTFFVVERPPQGQENPAIGFDYGYNSAAQTSCNSFARANPTLDVSLEDGDGYWACVSG